MHSKMTKREQRNLENNINQQLYRNLSREGIRMDHLDPTRCENWPLLDAPVSGGDHINLLPPSYRDPFLSSPKPAKKKKSIRPIHPTPKAQFTNFREQLRNEWDPPIQPNDPLSSQLPPWLISLLAVVSSVLLLG